MKPIHTGISVLILQVLSLLGAVHVYSAEALVNIIEVDCRKNCAIYASEKWHKKAIPVVLPPGKYLFVPLSGACSPWPKDQGARDNGDQPWMWYAIVSVGADQYELGSQAKFETPLVALEEQKDDKVTIRLEKETSVEIGLTDVWKGKDYCSDNRGKEKLQIYRVTEEK